MIVKGGSRARAAELAKHLSRRDTNEQVELIETRGTVAADLLGALSEMEAVSAGTRCRRPLYHANIDPDARYAMTGEQWQAAVEALEARLGLAGHPRVVVRHVKNRREHVHVVWSRIDLERMQAVSDSWNYRAHEEVARELERRFGHEHVQGVHIGREGADRAARTPSSAEMQQATRTGIQLDAVTRDLTAAWRSADNPAAFVRALEEKGYILARGDRRDFVAIDPAGGIHSLARRIEGAKTKDIRARLGRLDHTKLPTAAQAQEIQRHRAHEIETAGEDGDLLAGLLRTRAYVTEADIHRAFYDHPEKLGSRSPAAAVAAVLDRDDLVTLKDRKGGETVGYTIKAHREQEERVLARAKRMAASTDHHIAARALANAAETLDREQEAAMRHALADSGLTVIEGRAGTGKSHTLTAIRRAAEKGGYRVIGLAPTNTVAQDLEASGFTDAATVHSLLWYLENAPDHAKAQLNRRTVLIIDEAAMLATDILDRFTAQAERLGAKVILVGDDRQLGSVERGGLFTDIANSIGSAELTTVRRQRESWNRTAAKAFAEGRFADGLAVYQERGCIDWTDDLAAARNALVEKWKADTQEGRGNRFAFAYTNDEARRLNDAMQDIEIARGRVVNVAELETENGTLRIGEGDRLMFKGTDKKQHIYNGAFATVANIKDREDGSAALKVVTDKGREITLDTANFDKITLGYAGTIYKGQGKTLEDTYLLHTRHWRDASSYVALTRARSPSQLFVARDEAPNMGILASQMKRQQGRGSSLQFEPSFARDRAADKQTGSGNATDTALAKRQEAERQQLEAAQAKRAREAQEREARIVATDRAKLETALQQRFAREDKARSDARQREDAKRTKERSLLQRAKEALSTRERQRSAAAEKQITEARKQQDRELLKLRKQEIAAATDKLAKTQHDRAETERKARAEQFAAERGALLERQKEAARRMDEIQRRQRQREIEQQLERERGGRER
jgi:hypothetical protein